jgi:hypothetical protein
MEETPRELNHLSTWRRRNQIRDSPSSGERTGKSLNHSHVTGVNRCVGGVAGLVRLTFTSWREVKNLFHSRTPLGRAITEGENPVGEMEEASWDRYLSTVGLEKPCGNPGGPPSKAKYGSSYR